ncbi:MAG: hypothetical protein JNM22_06860 [Saprospiraceae bacterium]|nr:hypothetical protein [Saprospiraceae bacterium]
MYCTFVGTADANGDAHGIGRAQALRVWDERCYTDSLSTSGSGLANTSVFGVRYSVFEI